VPLLPVLWCELLRFRQGAGVPLRPRRLFDDPRSDPHNRTAGRLVRRRDKSVIAELADRPA
jgi:hypothetical protein